MTIQQKRENKRNHTFITRKECLKVQPSDTDVIEMKLKYEWIVNANVNVQDTFLYQTVNQKVIIYLISE